MKRLGIGLALMFAIVAAAQATAAGASSKSSVVPYSARPFGLKCTTPGQSYLCTDVADMSVDPDAPTGQVNVGGAGYQGDDNAYVGHDEPSLLFYSNAAGSGNNNYWNVTLPKQPPTFPSQAGAGSPSWDFELHPAFWFGMAMCDSTSYPNYTQTCNPNTDSNIYESTNPNAPDFISHHPGAAYMEFQFYPPGYGPFINAISCDPTKWCAAMVVWSFIEQANPFQFSNGACAGITGAEPGNFQFLSLGTSGVNVNGPADFWDATVGTFTPNSANLFMNSGDRLSIHMNDTAAGFKIQVNDLTSGQVGAALASGGNGFAHAPYNPGAGSCNPTPYTFHPMYSTSSEHTRVVWAAHSYNVAYSDEIGHFDLCSAISGFGGHCTGLEGGFDAQEPSDYAGGANPEDTGCFPASYSLLVPIQGCQGQNTGFDGTPYSTVAWPGTGQPSNMTPQPLKFKSPYFGSSPITGQYQRTAFETDLIALENSFPPYGGAPYTCSTQSAGPQCQNPPSTDDSTAGNVVQAFYPIFSTVLSTGWVGQCMWAEGGGNQFQTINNFGGTSTSEYGPPLGFYYPLNGASPGVRFRYENYRNIIANPCKN
jgi:hypothetical protein